MYRGKTVAFYGVLILVLVLIVTHTLQLILPARLATEIGHNSESLVFAIFFCAIVQFLLPWLSRRIRTPWPVTVPGGVLFFIAGYALWHSALPARLVTLNEPVIATGFMLLYLSPRRPLRYAPAVAVLVLAFIVIFFRTSFVLDQAESLVPAVLAPLALDVFHRTILEPSSRQRPVLRLVWTALLVLLAVGFMVTAPWARSDLDGPGSLAIDYGQRAAEAYWGWLLVHLYFGFWIGQARGWPAPRRDRRSPKVLVEKGLR